MLWCIGFVVRLAAEVIINKRGQEIGSELGSNAIFITAGSTIASGIVPGAMGLQVLQVQVPQAVGVQP